eukprot:scaffold141836_cov31-Prasinocladus_malaysianus.AAC.2
MTVCCLDMLNMNHKQYIKQDADRLFDKGQLAADTCIDSDHCTDCRSEQYLELAGLINSGDMY